MADLKKKKKKTFFGLLAKIKELRSFDIYHYCINKKTHAILLCIFGLEFNYII